MNFLDQLLLKIYEMRFASKSSISAKTQRTNSLTGQTVTQETALKLSAYYACVNLLSDMIASLPIKLYKRTKNGREEANEHPIALLMRRPNADMSGYEFRNYVGLSINVHGNAYSLKRYNNGELVGLLALDPTRVTPQLDGKKKVFKYNNPITGQTETYDEQDVLHVPGFGYDGLVGLSPLSYMRDALGIAISANDASAEAFNNAGVFTGAVTYDKTLSIPQRQELRENIPAQRGDALKNILLLDQGAKLQSFRISPADLQMIESKQFSVEDIVRFYRVPPHMVGHANTTTWGSGIEEQTLGFATYVLYPSHLSRIESALNTRLLPPEMQSEYYFEYVIEALFAADIEARTSHYSQMLQNGVYSRNEVRKTLNRPPIDGGDEYTVQVNLTVLDALREISNAK